MSAGRCRGLSRLLSAADPELRDAVVPLEKHFAR